MDIRRELGITAENEYIESKRKIDAYIAYQNEYKQKYGVFPELDKKNKPVTALFEDVYNAYDQFKRRSIIGTVFYHDVHDRFNKELQKLYHTYKREWSFMYTIGFNYRTTMDDIKRLTECTCIENNLGYTVDADGNYYEGTWENGRLVYGLIYFAASDTYFAGEVVYASTVHYKGIIFTYEKDKNTNLSLGTFFVKNNNVLPYDGKVFGAFTEQKRNNVVEIEMCIATYEQGYEEGKFLYKFFNSDGVQVNVKKYKDGALIGESGTGFVVAHLLLALASDFWWILKGTYGIPVYFIVRSIRRKKHL